MNKKIKRIIAVALTISAFSIVEPTKYINLTNTVEANAEVKGADLEKISLGRGSIDFKRSKTSYTVNVDNDIHELEIRATPKEEDAEVKIGGSTVDKDDKYEKVVNLDKGENIITIKVQNGSKKKTYTLTVIRGKIEEEKEIYLKSLALSSGDISFSKEKTSYDIKVKSDITRLTVKAIPEDDDYDVEINGVTANDDRNYKDTVSLIDGKNTVKIKIQDDNQYDEDSNNIYENTYTLNIYKESKTETNSSKTSNNTESTTETSTKINQWVQKDGKWQYNDATGNTLIEKWFYDKNNSQIYYLQADGTMARGWLSNNGHWYYLNESGAKQIGWKDINGTWYYLDSNGIMQTGWFKDIDGKWYYLQESGAMAKNTKISGYKLNQDGIWIN